ncbi:MAG: sodium-dependent transporter [Clostridiales bacterium]|nr:sodium-dependent transporter [Clostridiales bacterium]
MQREHLGSRLGFLLLSAGCAIGIGNVWKFPWMTGQYGGGAFVLIYLLFLLILGVPVLTMEFAMGRAAQKSPLKMYGQLKPGTKWGWHGYVCLLGNVVLMMFYTTVSGWMLQYFVNTAAGAFAGLDTAGIEAKFGEMLASPGIMALYMGIVVVIGFSVISLGVQKGLERVTKWMMMSLILLMWVLAFHSMTLPGGSTGLTFYLIPDFQRMSGIGVGSVIVGAMNQAFFTLSLGIGAMAIFGSYIGKDHALMGEAIRVSLLDTMVALCSGLIIFPACFAYGVDVNSGPALIFMTLPNVFNHIALGRFWGSLFFLFLTFAAFSTVLAVFENIVCCVSEMTLWSRKKTCAVCCVCMFLLSLPCLLGYNLWQNVRPVAGHDILDSEDFLVSNILLPLGSLIFVLFCTTRYGWGWEKFLKEANEGTGLKVAKWMRPYMTYILPVIVLVIFVVGLVGFF